MQEEELEKLKYPLGKLKIAEEYTTEQLEEWVNKLDRFPSDLTQVVQALKKNELDFSYRPGGWSVRQIIHHISDSHVNAYVRLKLSLTENTPTIKPYNENKWVLTPDALSDDFQSTLLITEHIHKKMVMVLKRLSKNDYQRTYIHPDLDTPVSIGQLVCIYAWHGHHHLAQIKVALQKQF